MTRLLERRFKVRASIKKAWSHLEMIESWPSWAQHIRRVELSPPGHLQQDSEGTIELTNGIRSTFRIVELNAGRNWKWVGPFLWLAVHYDHQFQQIGLDQTEVIFLLDAEGFGVGVFGRLFAAIYARNLDRAIPRLVREIEAA
jgi:hypothetical protein